MQTILASEVFVFDVYQLIVVRTGMRSARGARARTLRIEREVTLSGNGRKLRTHPVGTGSHRGHATILLRPNGDFGHALECLASMREGLTIQLRPCGDDAEEPVTHPTSTTLRSVVVDAI